MGGNSKPRQAEQNHAPPFVLEHVFGCRSDVNRSLCAVAGANGRNIAYVAGNRVVIQEVTGFAQTLLPRPTELGGRISALASDARGRYLAVAESARIALREVTQPQRGALGSTTEVLSARETNAQGVDEENAETTLTSPVAQQKTRGFRRPMIVIHDLLRHKRRVLDLGLKVAQHLSGKNPTDDAWRRAEAANIVSMDFSPTSNLLATLVEAPNPILFVWHWEKSLLFAHHSLGAGFKSVRFAPQPQASSSCAAAAAGNRLMVLGGGNELRLFTLENRLLKMTNLYAQCHSSLANLTPGEEHVYNFQDACWLSATACVVATTSGHLLCFDMLGSQAADRTLQFRGIVDVLPHDIDRISSITVSREIVYCGCSGGDFLVLRPPGTETIVQVSKKKQTGANLAIAEADASNRLQTQQEKYPVRGDMGWVLLAQFRNFEDSSETAAVMACLNGSRICTLSLDSQLFSLRTDQIDVMKAKDMNFERLSPGLHSVRVNDVSVCSRRPLALSAGRDASLRLWNYIDVDLVHAQYFSKEALSVALHPIGYYAAASFRDCVKWFSITQNEFVCFHEVALKDCCSMSFSEGGDLLALASPSKIEVYEWMTGDNISSLHLESANLTKISWGEDCKRIVAATQTGLLEVDLLSNTKTQDYHHKEEGVSFFMAVSTQRDTIIAAASDRSLHKVVDEHLVVSVPLDIRLTAIHRTTTSNLGSLLFAGTSDGELRVFDLNGHCVSFNVASMFIASAPILALKTTSCARYLIVASEDGSVSVVNLNSDALLAASNPSAVQTLFKKRTSHRTHALAPDPIQGFIEDTLVSKEELDEQRRGHVKQRQELRRIETMKHQEQRAKREQENHQITELEERFADELTAAQQRPHFLETEKMKAQEEFDVQLEELSKTHHDELCELERQHTQKLKSENERLMELGVRRSTEKDCRMRDDKAREEMSKAEISELRQDLSQQIETELTVTAKLTDELQRLKSCLAEMKEAMDDEAEERLDAVKRELSAVLEVERETTLVLRGENGILKRRFQSLQQKIATQQRTISAAVERERKLYDDIARLEKDLENLKREIIERDATVRDKERRISNLTVKNQELQKFKFVLDYKIKELHRQIRPREAEISTLEDTITKTQQEVAELSQQNAIDKLERSQLQFKIAGIEQDCKQYKAQVSAWRRRRLVILQSLEEALRSFKDTQEVPEFTHALTELYHKVQRLAQRKDDEDFDKEAADIVETDGRGEAAFGETALRNLLLLPQASKSKVQSFVRFVFKSFTKGVFS
ncbi:MAG: hypothetical protein MHM6MM_000722 [Cercozoa sp. M6MM]